MGDMRDTGHASEQQWEKLLLRENSSQQGLNTALRQGLQEFARTRNHQFQQDNIGNIYVTRAGTDSDLSAIALAFPLDSSPSSTSALSSAAQVFLELENSKTSCDVTLLGWSSPHGSPIGRDVWEGTIAAETGYEEEPELERFQGLGDVKTFSLSAVFGFVETEERLVARGSPVLTEKVRKAAVAESGDWDVDVEFGGPMSRRVPVASVEGKGAVAVGKSTVQQYSRYVVGMFENFD